MTRHFWFPDRTSGEEGSGSSDSVNIMDCGADPTGLPGTEAVNNAAFLCAIDKARQKIAVHSSVGCAIVLPSGAFRVSQPITLNVLTDDRIGFVGAGRTLTNITTSTPDIDLMVFEGGTASTGLVENMIADLKLQYLGPERDPAGMTPADLRMRPALLRCNNVIDFSIENVVFEGGYNSLVINRGGRVNINGIQIFVRANLYEAHAGVIFTATPEMPGTATRVFMQSFDIQNRGTAGDLSLTHGILIEAADGIQVDTGHIIHCRNDLTISPDNSTNQDVCGGIIFNNVYFDVCHTYSVLIEGTATSFGRIYFDQCRSLNAGSDGYRINPSSLLTLMQLNGGDIMGAGRYGLNCATANITGLSINGTEFRENNISPGTANAGDMLLRGTNVEVEAKVFGGGAPGTAVTLASDLTSGTVEVDTSASTAGTKFDDNSSGVQRKPSEIEAQTYTPTFTTVTNLDSASLLGATYQRLGDIVTVFIGFAADPTAAGACELGVSLPIASNFASVGHATGTLTSATEFGRIEADVTNDRFSFQFTAVTTTLHSFSASATYRIL